jgi:PleD family two-component response regulator
MTDTKRSKILVVDDSEVSAAYLEIFLKKMGFLSIHAVNGLDVMRILTLRKVPR